ncbi:TadE family protein [Litorihabitans aurantiacus]|uniref:TadE family protein n=1 Tax=Litorihabitans aurantiacus TaxID=1930061 RepID=UPI0024E17E81|nr:TadE family protein [Litorihabitans aurantiacus]
MLGVVQLAYALWVRTVLVDAAAEGRGTPRCSTATSPRASSARGTWRRAGSPTPPCRVRPQRSSPRRATTS